VNLDVTTPVVVLAPTFRLGVGHAIARTLGRLGVPVYGVHGDIRSPAARSRYWRRTVEWDFDAAEPEATVSRLAGLAAEIGRRPILIPTSDSSCLFVDDWSEDLAQHFLLPRRPPGLARRLSNKQAMYELCQELGIATASTVFPRSRADVERFAESATFPVMLKGIDTFALHRRKGVRMAFTADAAELLRMYDELESPEQPNLMLQAYVPGGSERVWMFNGYFDAASECRFGLTGRKLRQFPADKGVTCLGICEANAEVYRLTVETMHRLGYTGVLDIGYKQDPRTGEYLLLDVNPRVGVSFRLFVDSVGMDVVRVLYLDLTDQEVVVGAPVPGRKWWVENFDLATAFGYWRAGRLGLSEWARSLRGVREGSWFAADDPRPAFAMAWRSLAYALAATERPATPAIEREIQPRPVS
jgi:D-aspartate ligase